MSSYIFQAILFQLIFIVIYDLMFRKETFFLYNRIYLIGSFLLSFVLPLFPLSYFEEVKATIQFSSFQFEELTMNKSIISDIDVYGNSFSVFQIIYILGIAITSIILLLKLNRLSILKSFSNKKEYPFYSVYTIPNSSEIFSFYRSVFIGEKSKNKLNDSILNHELVHIQQKHSIDLLLFEVGRIIMWFNPLVYIYQSRISELHEYISDSKSNKSTTNYQSLLNGFFKTKNVSFINSFYNKSLLRKRIFMLQRKESTLKNKLKFLMLIPILVLMLVFTSFQNNGSYIGQAEQGENIKSKYSDSELIGFNDLDRAPGVPGCSEEIDNKKCFLEYIRSHVLSNFVYPEEAVELKQEGTVFVQISISNKGIIDFVNINAPYDSLKVASIEIIESFPNFTPAIKDGENVRTLIMFPIEFKL